MPAGEPGEETQVARLVRVAQAVRELIDADGDLINPCDDEAALSDVIELEEAMRALRPSDFDDQRSFYPQDAAICMECHAGLNPATGKAVHHSWCSSFSKA